MRPALLHAVWFGAVCQRALCGDYAGDEWTVPHREGAPCARSVPDTPGQNLQVTACGLVSSMNESAQEPRKGRPPRSSSGVARAPNMQPARHVGFVACSSVLVSVDLRRPPTGSSGSGHRSLHRCLGFACVARRAAWPFTRACAQRQVRLPAAHSVKRHTWLDAAVHERSCGPRGTGPLAQALSASAGRPPSAPRP